MTTSISIQIEPKDSRCSYWAKILRAGAPLPKPNEVTVANSIEAKYSKKGDEELFPGDFLIEGESIHHRKARGFNYRISFINKNGELETISPTSGHKKAMKEDLLPQELLSGAGELAACIRIAHAVNLGINYTPTKLENECAST